VRDIQEKRCWPRTCLDAVETPCAIKVIHMFTILTLIVGAPKALDSSTLMYKPSTTPPSCLSEVEGSRPLTAPNIYHRTIFASADRCFHYDVSTALPSFDDDRVPILGLSSSSWPSGVPSDTSESARHIRLSGSSSSAEASPEIGGGQIASLGMPCFKRAPSCSATSSR